MTARLSIPMAVKHAGDLRHLEVDLPAPAMLAEGLADHLGEGL